MEQLQPLNEFKNLCYLLTSRNVTEIFKDREGIAASREKLIEQIQLIMDYNDRDIGNIISF